MRIAMRIHTVLFVSLLLSCISPACVGQDSGANTAAADETKTMVYPDSADGLKNLLQNFALAMAKPDDEHFLRMTRTMVVDDPTWFTKAFGQELGSEIAKRYGQPSNQLTSTLIPAIRYGLQPAQDTILITRVERAEETAPSNLRAVQKAMVSPVPLYFVQIAKKAEEKPRDIHGVFVYVEGSFRYLPENALLVVPGTHSSVPPRIRVGGNIMQTMLTHQVQPVYPPDALRNRIQGKVVLHAIITKDGTIQQLEVVSGPRELYQSALEAVRHWTFKPVLLDGQAVEVDTLISVAYTTGH